MSLAPGSRLGPYEIVSILGAGGMGEVYRATDTVLKRQVAIKVLPDTFAHDSDRLARFQREAQVLASLNHPHIAQIHGLEKAEGTTAIVMELVEGITLHERIAERPLPVDEALRLGKQIAEALDAAHAQGIVHRDLKPSNIKVRPDGTVKVLDFGLAKAAEPTGQAASGVSESPTITTPAMTQAGIVLGTAAYMSPEQARGRPVDKRADIWAFGAVLYEMLTGRRAFDGADAAEVLGAVMRLEPDWQALPGRLPLAVSWALQHCLRKDPAQRLRDIGDVRILLDEGPSAPAGVPAPPSGSRWIRYAGYVVPALVTWAVLVLTGSLSPGPADLPVTRLQVMTEGTEDVWSFALAPDGRSLVYGLVESGQSRLWLRRFESDVDTPLPGTDGGESPFWSPDGQSVGFFGAGTLKRLDLASGFVRTLADAANPRGADWNRDGTIVFASNVGPLMRVPADGGTVTEVTRLLPGQTNHRMPRFLPDGRRFLFYALGVPDSRGLYLGSLDDRAVQRVSERDSAFAWLPPGWVVLAREGALWARRLNLEGPALEGDLVPVAREVLAAVNTPGLGALSVSASGTVAYRRSAGTQQLAWLDRAGRLVGEVGQPGDLRLPRISSDGHTAAVVRTDKGNDDVWTLDVERGTARRLTTGPGADSEPVFSPDGRQVAYVTDAAADIWDIMLRSAEGTGDESLLLETPENKMALDWSSDGFLLFTSQSPEGNLDLWAVAVEGGQPPIPIAQTKDFEYDGRFSPDGALVAFVSNESGQHEVYLQAFPGPGPRRQASVGGGTDPRWSHDGRELFYVTSDRRLTAVSVTTGPASIEPTPPRTLFTFPERTAPDLGYEPAPDGQRFLVVKTMADPSPITVVFNWSPPGH